MAKKITLFQCSALVSGNLVGSGVFMLPALLAVYGSLSIVGWSISSIGAIFLALMFARLSQSVTVQSGGPHTFIRAAFGDRAAFWVAWGYWVLTWSSNTALLVASVSYLAKITGAMSLHSTFLVEVSIWLIITLINLRGVAEAAKFEFFITVIKLIPIVLIPVIALFYVDTHNFYFVHNNSSVASALKNVVFLSLWGFIGVESATVPAEEVDNPKRVIPIATIIGTLVATLVYVLGSVTTLGVLGASVAHSSAPYADLATKLFSGDWGIFIAIIAVISCVGTFHGWCLVGARIAYGAALQGLFPKVFAKKNREDTPINSIIISSLCTFVTIFFTLQADMLMQFKMIIDIAVTLILLIYLASSLAYLKLLSSHSYISYLVVAGSILFSLFGIYASGYETVGLSLLLLATGLPFYLRVIKIKK